VDTSKRRPGRKPKKVVGQDRSAINFRIEAKLRRELVAAAKAANRSLAAQIEHCISFALAAEKVIGDVREYAGRRKRAIDIQAGAAPSPGRFLTEEEAKHFITDEQFKAEIAEVRRLAEAAMAKASAKDDEPA
jgi:hypothetical protein